MPAQPPSVSRERDLQHPYLKRQLIAYIGNKRALQGFLAGVFSDLEPEPGRRVFLDPFAGSGAVARLARYLGFQVRANDWEFYAYVLNYAHLCVGRSESTGLFGPAGGLGRVLDELNRLEAPRDEELYIARHYAPADTAAAHWRLERLFYTRENALRIDAVRSRIEALYPGFELEGQARKEKLLLLASLLYQSATHTNTSGVFKACHKGFGGHGGDALSRILAPVRLQVPELVDGPEAEAECLDAAEFARRHPADLCYLDPPYNQHQYGSNYHLLNTIALWDRPEVSAERGPDGRLRHKAGIRADWVRTRSPYCSRTLAPGAFRELLQAVDARRIVISYAAGGRIPLEELVDLLASQGRLSVYTSDTVTYRGGRQSLARRLHTQELVLVLERGAEGAAGGLKEFRRIAALNSLRLLLRRSFDPRRIAARFPTSGEGIEVSLGGRTRVLPLAHRYRFLPDAAGIVQEAAAGPPQATEGELTALVQALEACQFTNLHKEAEALISMLADPADALSLSKGERIRAQRQVLQLLRKYAHRKYRQHFEATVERLRALVRDSGDRGEDWALVARELPGIEALARVRFEG